MPEYPGMTQYLYSKLISPTSSVLIHEVIVLGLFFVFAAYIRVAMEARRIEDASFKPLKRFVMLAGVLLLALYNAISYEIDAMSATVRPDAEVTSLVLTQLLLIAPLDLALVAVAALLFLVLGHEAVMGRDKGSERGTIAVDVQRCFLLTALWHTLCLPWWLMFIGAHPWSTVVESLQFHAAYATVHSVCALVWSRVGFREDESRRWGVWVPVLVYFVVVASLYAWRLAWYIRGAQDVL